MIIKLSYFVKLVEMSKESECNIDCDRSEMLSARYHWRCKWCSIEFKKGWMTRLKQHLASGYPDLIIYQKYPQEVQQLMTKYFIDSKAAK